MQLAFNNFLQCLASRLLPCMFMCPRPSHNNAAGSQGWALGVGQGPALNAGAMIKNCASVWRPAMSIAVQLLVAKRRQAAGGRRRRVHTRSKAARGSGSGSGSSARKSRKIQKPKSFAFIVICMRAGQHSGAEGGRIGGRDRGVGEGKACAT